MYLNVLWGRRLKKVRKSAPPDKILATPMAVIITSFCSSRVDKCGTAPGRPPTRKQDHSIRTIVANYRTRLNRIYNVTPQSTSTNARLYLLLRCQNSVLQHLDRQLSWITSMINNWLMINRWFMSLFLVVDHRRTKTGLFEDGCRDRSSWGSFCSKSRIYYKLR